MVVPMVTRAVMDRQKHSTLPSQKTIVKAIAHKLKKKYRYGKIGIRTNVSNPALEEKEHAEAK